MKKLLSMIWRFNQSGSLSSLSHTRMESYRFYATMKRPIVIGGSNIDIVATATEDILMDGRMLNGTISQCRGGVGRNIADALTRLQADPMFITAVGNDEMGEFLMNGSKHMDRRGFLHCNQASACCCVIVDKAGDCKFIVGNMTIHTNISLEWIHRFESEIANSNFLVIDGNLKPDAINYVLRICRSRNIPVWFEPTDVSICDLVLSTEWTTITHMSPNFNELKQMASVLSGKDYSSINPSDLQDTITQSIALSRHFPKSMILMVTLDKHGMLIISGDNVKHYKALPISNITNVSGAGDCAVAGYIAAQLCYKSETERVAAALSCAQQSLMSTTPVPSIMSLDIIDMTPTTIEINS